MTTQRPPASRRVATGLCLALGLAVAVVSLIVLAADRLGSSAIAAHVVEVYAPHGQDPDPQVLWVYLLVVSVASVLGWSLALRLVARGRRTARLWVTTLFVIGASVMIFTGVVTEHGEAILPLRWRAMSIAQAGIGAFAVLVAWLPLNERVVD